MSDGPPPITWAIKRLPPIPYLTPSPEGSTKPDFSLPPSKFLCPRQEMINHLVAVPRDDVTVETNLFKKIKNRFLNADSGVQLDDTGAAVQDTSSHRRGPAAGPFLFCNEVLQFTFHQGD